MKITQENVHKKSKKILVITGPTATGKTGVAVDVALKLNPNGEVVYADSAAVYRNLNIGTAKPTADEMRGVPHHLIDVCNVDDNFDAEQYSKMAGEVVNNILQDGKIPIVTGGTGLYIKALIHGLFSIPSDSGKTKNQILKELDEKGLDHIFAQLKTVDPKSAETINKNDRSRIIRALEICRLTGKSAAKIKEEHSFKDSVFNPIYIGLAMERVKLHERINSRVDEMINSGIIDEVKGLLESGYSPACRSLNTIGYKEIASFINGEIDRETAIHLIKRNTRRLAKRQMTWFKKVEGIHWFQYPYDISKIIEKSKTDLHLK